MKPSAEIEAPKQWTKEEEERLRQLFLQNETPNEIAHVLGRSVSAVKAKAHALGMTSAQLGNRIRRGVARWG
jgi:hypothetical protein